MKTGLRPTIVAFFLTAFNLSAATLLVSLGKTAVFRGILAAQNVVPHPPDQS